MTLLSAQSELLTSVDKSGLMQAVIRGRAVIPSLIHIVGLFLGRPVAGGTPLMRHSLLMSAKERRVFQEGTNATETTIVASYLAR